jgi:hypothetical protein
MFLRGIMFNQDTRIYTLQFFQKKSDFLGYLVY